MSSKKILMFAVLTVVTVGYLLINFKVPSKEKQISSATSSVKHWIKKSVRSIKKIAKVDVFDDIASMSADAVKFEIKSIDEEIFTPEKIEQLNQNLLSESEREEIATLLARRSKLIEVYFKEEVEKITADANVVMQDAQKKLQDYQMEKEVAHE